MASFGFTSVSKRFGTVQAVSGLSFAAGDGEFFVLLGPTGAGKTTLLRLLAGLERADGGHVSISGRDVTDVPPAERNVAFVFQQYSLYPHLSVFDNLAFPLRAPSARVAEAAIRERVEAVAATLHIGHKLRNPATQLSGGEMQRVAIGRALVRRPAVTLMDEPLSSLDAKLRAELRVELKRTQAELGSTFLYVTHDQVEAMTLATRIGVMDAGRLVQVGTPQDIYERPANLYVAGRLGTPAINLLPAGLVAGSDGPGAVTAGLRTEHLHIHPDPAGPGRILRIEHLGDQSHVHVQLGAHRLVALSDPHAGWGLGQAVQVRAQGGLLFGQDGARLEVAA